MSVVLKQHVQKTVAAEEQQHVVEIAEKLLMYLNLNEVQQAIENANQPGASSAKVQSTFNEFATKKLGFRSEARGLFNNYLTAGLRPDYYLSLGETLNTGILLEVERGKTTMNNMDILDFWKCHICEHAHYLFLLVPQELRQKESATVRREFETVNRRLRPFFDLEENYTNVRGLFLFGY